MLGRLARWLRFVGYDTRYYQDMEPLELYAIARREDRFFLTRNYLFSNMDGVILVDHDDIREQVFILSGQIDIDLEPKPLFCPVCNGELEDVKFKSEIEHLVPEYTYNIQERFHRCTSCGKIYWKGSHVERAKDFIGARDEK